MLPVAVAMLGTGARRPTVGFVGSFGPRDLASIVFAVILIEEGGLLHAALLITTIVTATAARWRTLGTGIRTNHSG